MAFTKKERELIKATKMQGKGNDQDLDLFLHFAEKSGLDPLTNQLNAVFRWDDRQKKHVMSIQTGIDGYRLTADRTGAYAGSDDYLFDDNLTTFHHMQKSNGQPPRTATCTIYKIVQAHRVPYTATADWKSYCPSGNAAFMWKKMPYLMLGKCAEALALRKGFPQELSGIYTEEEMAQAGGELIEHQKTETSPEQTATTSKDAEKPKSSPEKEKAPEKPKSNGVSRPLSPANLKENLLKKAENMSKELRQTEAKQATCNIIAALMQRAYTPPPQDGQEVENRKEEVQAATDKYHSFLRFIYEDRAGEPPSSKNLSQADALSLLAWISGGKASFKAELMPESVKEAWLVWEQL